ncbi:MAG: type II toxin-antitoxin system HicB family antitoxin [Bacteroidetes bacterium]|nr:type II toxin-antitoxin system HicB family antitoxin [Bacteroidota bacterium]
MLTVDNLLSIFYVEYIIPSLPGCITYGDTIEEAIELAKEAIGLYRESSYFLSLRI